MRRRLSASTLARAYLGALARLDAWLGTAPVDDASLAVYLGKLFEAGRAPATAALAVAAVRFRAKLAGQPAPAGEATARVNGRLPAHGLPTGAGARPPRCARTGSPRFSPPPPVPAPTAGALNPTPRRQRLRPHGRRKIRRVAVHGRAAAGRKSPHVRWADVTDAWPTATNGSLVTVRTSKTNQEGDAADVRYLKNAHHAKAHPHPSRTPTPTAAPTVFLRDRVVGRYRFSAASPRPPAPPASRRRVTAHRVAGSGSRPN